MRVIWTGIVFIWKLFWGMLFCQAPVLSLMVVGWTYRQMQRTVLKSWWRGSTAYVGRADFGSFCREQSESASLADWPNWFLRQNFRESMAKEKGRGALHYVWAFTVGLFHSLWINLRTGFIGIMNTWALTLPGCVIMYFSWYDGWNNSFNKGYEQAVVGPSTGFLGIFLFILAMLYVPLAQVRQAVSNDIRSFYDYRLIASIVRRRWLACCGLAALYSAIFIPISILTILPMYFPNMKPEILGYTNQQQLEFLNRYYFWGAIVLFPAFLFVRTVAARIYARGLLKNIKDGVAKREWLCEWERKALERVELLHEGSEPKRHPIIALAGGTSRLIFTGTAAFVVVFLWFTMVAQVYIAQFLNYVPWGGWLNHPLVHLPWIRFIPEILR